MVLNVIPIGMNDQRLARRIAGVAADSSKVVIVSHAKQRMRQRGVLLTQVLQVLQKGRVTDHAHRNVHGNWQCTLEATIAGDRIKVAAALQEDPNGDLVIVITVMN